MICGLIGATACGIGLFAVTVASVVGILAGIAALLFGAVSVAAWIGRCWR